MIFSLVFVSIRVGTLTIRGFESTLIDNRNTIMAYDHHRCGLAPTVLAIAGMLVLGALLTAAGQSKRPAKPASTTETKRPPRDAAVPFNPGERLSFRVIWSKFSVNAATI